MNERLMNWVEAFGEGEEGFDFLRKVITLMNGEIMDGVHNGLNQKAPADLVLPDGVTFVYDMGVVVGVNFGDFEADYYQIGEFLNAEGFIRKAVVYYI